MQINFEKVVIFWAVAAVYDEKNQPETTFFGAARTDAEARCRALDEVAARFRSGQFTSLGAVRIQVFELVVQDGRFLAQERGAKGWRDSQLSCRTVVELLLEQTRSHGGPNPDFDDPGDLSENDLARRLQYAKVVLGAGL